MQPTLEKNERAKFAWPKLVKYNINFKLKTVAV